jgi:hypothetical protein
MGFDDGATLGKLSEFNACKFEDDNYCAATDKDFIMTDVNCTGGEDKLINCGGTYSPNCGVEMTAIGECKGDGGDTSGAS